MQFLQESLVELITQTSTNLPPDVRQAMGIAIAAETPHTQASQALGIIATNIDMAADDQGPICQDTGMPTFDVHTPVGVNQIAIKKAIRAAVAEATKRGKLRPNSVDSLTGKNSGDNLGEETPVIHFEQWEQDEIEVKLILKGGGCENKNIQYSLPMELDHLGKAGRDLEGVRKCILHAVWQAQGQGCAPGAVGVCIGSDRAQGYLLAKYQLFRTLDDTNPIPELAKLEAEIMEEANKIGVGAMGFGGKSSLIGCKITRRQPAARELLRERRLRLLGVPEAGREARRIQRRDHEMAVSRSGAAGGEDGSRRRVPVDGERSDPAAAADRRAGSGAQGRRRGADHGRDVHRPRCRARAPDEESAAGGYARIGAVSLRSGDAEARGAVDGQGRRSDHQHPRRAVSGRYHPQLRRARGDRQRRDGEEDAGGACRIQARCI